MMNILRWKGNIQRQTALGFIVVVIVIAGIGGNEVYTFFQLSKTRDRVTEAYDVLARVEEIAKLTHEAEAAGWGFLVTGDETFVLRLETAAGRIDEFIENLRGAFANDRVRQARLDSTLVLTRSRVGFLKRVVDTARAAGRTEAVALVKTGEGRTMPETIRELIGRMEADETHLLVQAASEEAGLSRNTLLMMALGLLLQVGTLTVLYIAIARDISGRKKATEELTETARLLHEREEQVRLATEAAQIGLWYWDVPTDNLVWNSMGRKLFGIPPGTKMSYSVLLQALHPDDREHADNLMRMSFEKKTPYRTDYRVVWPDGSVHWLSALGKSEYDAEGRVTRMMGVVVDIDARKRAEEALQEKGRLLEDSEKRYRYMFESAPVSLWEGDFSWAYEKMNDIRKSGVQEIAEFLTAHPEFAQEALSHFAVRDVNEYTLELFGAKDKHVLLSRLGTIFTQEALGVFAAELVAIFEGQSEFQSEARLRTLDGRALTTLLTVNFPPDPSQFDRVLVSIMDITALKNVQNELQRSNSELEQFAYVASHDLQEPLRMVSSYVQLLGERYRGKLDADADDFIHFAVDGAVRMQNLINDLLMFSRVGTRGREFAPTNLNEVADSVLLSIQGLVDETGGAVTRGPLPNIVADESQMRQLLQNLIANGLKFARDDVPPQIHISAQEAPGEYEIAVSDNGIGIEADFFERIFVLFQRLDRKAKYQGTGIGLAVCRKIVERHGGRIWVESDPGKGSTFMFTIPKREGHNHER